MKSLQTICLLFALAGCACAQQYTISTVAGIPQVAGLFPGPGDLDVVLATGAQLYHPSTVVTDSNGNFYIGDLYTYSVRKVTVATGDITTIAGDATPGFTGDGEAAISASIGDVHGIAVDGSGNVYISDTSNYRIRKIDTSGIITTFAGNGARGYSGDGGKATSASFVPGALAFDSKGNLYIADYTNSVVRMISGSGTISTFAGTGAYGYLGDGGPASSAVLAYPESLAFDAAGNLYIGDVGNTDIRKVDTKGNITTAASNITPQGLGVDTAGNLYYVDGVSSTIREILATGGVVTIAGNGTPGYAGDGAFNGTAYAGSQASLAMLNQATGLTVTSNGTIYVADTMNNIIRQLSPVPASVGVQNAASEMPGSNLQPGFVAPGEMVTLFGSGLGPSTLTEFTLGTNGLFPTQLAGTSVTFNGTAAPIVYTSSGLVAVVAPYEILNSGTATIVVTYQGNSFTASMPVAATVPAVFTLDTSGSGQAAAINDANGTVNTAANPAKLGSYITLYATGEGSTTAPVDGKPASATCGISCLPMPQQQVMVKIGNQIVTPSYAGGAPTLVAGVMQVNVQIPATLIPGAVLVQVTVNGYPSQGGVTIAVSQ